MLEHHGDLVITSSNHPFSQASTTVHSFSSLGRAEAFIAKTRTWAIRPLDDVRASSFVLRASSLLGLRASSFELRASSFWGLRTPQFRRSGTEHAAFVHNPAKAVRRPERRQPIYGWPAPGPLHPLHRRPANCELHRTELGCCLCRHAVAEHSVAALQGSD